MEFVEILDETGQRIGVARNTETSDNTGHTRVRAIGGSNIAPITQEEFTQAIEETASLVAAAQVDQASSVLSQPSSR